MKILESQSATLTNAEVLTHLLSLSSSKTPATTTPPTTILTTLTTPPLKSPNFETIRASCVEYLTSGHIAPSTTTPPSPLPDYTSPPFTASTTRALLTALRAYELSKAELLMLVNLRPRDLGLLDCVVEECDERFGEGEQVGILGVVGGEGGERGEES